MNMGASRDMRMTGALRGPSGIGKASSNRAPGDNMYGIAAIAAFLVVMLALNWLDFGRLD